MSLNLSKNHQFPFARRVVNLGVTLAVCLCVSTGTVLAEQDEWLIEEVVVSAQKRDQSTTKVPISITALSGKMLDDMNATDIDDLLNFVPGVFFANRGTPGENTFIIRGMGIPVNGSASTSAVYIDEIPVTSAKRLPEIRTFDVERVEVLRGPQGTLYGEGAMGGAVKVVSKQPDSEGFSSAFGVSVESTRKGGGIGYVANAMINLPVSENAAFRVVGFRQDLDGFIDDVSTGEDNHNDSKISGGRAAFKVAFTDNFDFLATAYYEKQDIGGFGDHNPTGLGDLQTDNIGVDENRENEFKAWSAVFNWDLGAATLTSATSGYDYVGEGTSYTGFLSNFNPAHEGFFQEIRLASNVTEDSNLEWLVGVFYKDFEFSEDFPDFFFKIGGKSEQTAVFGDLTYHFSDAWALTVGARYAEEDVEGTFFNVRTEEVSDDAITSKFVVSHTPNDNSLFYLSAAQGFRSSGVAVFAASLPSPLNEITTFDHDDLWTYELGAKITSPDNTWLAEAAVYFTDWNNIQVLLDPPGPGFTIINSPDGAHVLGIEGSITWMAPIEGLQISVNGSLIESEFDGSDPAGLGKFSKGDRINDVPEWTYSAILQYNFTLSDGLDAYARFEHSGRGDYIHATRSTIPSLQTGNLRFGIETESGLQASIWVENFTDKRGISALDNDISFFPIPNKPRTVGITFRKNF